MNNREKIMKKINAIADREIARRDWEIPEIGYRMADIYEGFKTLYEISQDDKVTDEAQMKEAVTFEAITENINSILSYEGYKKYHSFLRKTVIPEVIKMSDEIRAKELSKNSISIKKANIIIDQIATIKKRSETEYNFLKGIIESGSRGAVSNAHFEGDHYLLISDLKQLNTIKEYLSNLKTVPEFEGDLKEVTSKGIKECNSVFKEVLDKQKELEKLDAKNKPDCSLYPGNPKPSSAYDENNAGIQPKIKTK